MRHNGNGIPNSDFLVLKCFGIISPALGIASYCIRMHLDKNSQHFILITPNKLDCFITLGGKMGSITVCQIESHRIYYSNCLCQPGVPNEDPTDRLDGARSPSLVLLVLPLLWPVG